jgi:hypothetical protein
LDGVYGHNVRRAETDRVVFDDDAAVTFAKRSDRKQNKR